MLTVRIGRVVLYVQKGFSAPLPPLSLALSLSLQFLSFSLLFHYVAMSNDEKPPKIPLSFKVLVFHKHLLFVVCFCLFTAHCCLAACFFVCVCVCHRDT